jgi:hypothetical protein
MLTKLSSATPHSLIKILTVAVTHSLIDQVVPSFADDNPLNTPARLENILFDASILNKLPRFETAKTKKPKNITRVETNSA